MGSKIAKNFLIAVKGNKEWLQAVSKSAVEKINPAEAPVFMQEPLKKAFALAADSKYGLAQRAAKKSRDVRKEIAAILAGVIVKDTDAWMNVLASREEAEWDARFEQLKISAIDDLYAGFKDEDKARALLHDLGYLRSLPADEYENAEMIRAYEKTTSVSLAIGDVLFNTNYPRNPVEKAAQVEMYLNQMEASDLLRMALSCGVDFGDRPDAFGDGGMYKEQAKARFNVEKSVMRHWDDLGVDEKGRAYDAFIAGYGAQRRTYVRAEFIQKKLNNAL